MFCMRLTQKKNWLRHSRPDPRLSRFLLPVLPSVYPIFWISSIRFSQIFFLRCAKENAGSGIIKQNRRYNTNTGSSSWGGALKGGAVPSGDIIEYSLGESQVLNSMQEELDKAQKRKKKQLGIITLKRVDRADVFSTTIDWNSATTVNSSNKLSQTNQEVNRKTGCFFQLKLPDSFPFNDDKKRCSTRIVPGCHLKGLACRYHKCCIYG